MTVPAPRPDKGDTGEEWTCREQALVIAYLAHLGQTDKAGRPYIEHPGRVAAEVAVLGPEYEATAWLHDVVEDSHITLDTLRAEGIPGQVVDAVDALTHREGESRADYYERVRANRIAFAVKQADIADNLNPGRLAMLPPGEATRLEKKYAKATAALFGRSDDRD